MGESKPDQEKQSRLLDELASDLILFDASSPGGFQGLAKKFLDLAGLFGPAQSRPQALAQNMAAILTSEEGKGGPERERALDLAGRLVLACQSALQKGTPEAQISWPPELGGQDESAQPDPKPAPSPAFPCPDHVDQTIFADFLNRQPAVLEEMENLLLGLESGHDPEAPGALKRLFHTLKGDSGLLGLDDVHRLAAFAEEVLLEPDPGRFTDGLLAIKDWLQKAYDHYAGKGPAPDPAGQFQARCRPADRSKPPDPPDQSDPSDPSDPSDQPDLPHVSQASPVSQPSQVSQPPLPEETPFENDPGLLQEFITEAHEHLEASDQHMLTLDADPSSVEALNAVMRAFHTIKGVAGFLGLDHIRAIAHQAENLMVKVRNRELAFGGPVTDVIFEVIDVLKKLVNELARSLAGGEPRRPLYPAIQELLGRLAAAGQPKITPTQTAIPKPPEEIPPADGLPSAPPVETSGPVSLDPLSRPGNGTRDASEPQDQGKNQGTAKAELKETIKVDAERLDRLVDMIGELVIAESMVAQSSELRQNASAVILRQLGQLDKITRELQEIGMALRMVPVRATFQKMARLVRDLSKKLGKPVEFVMDGEETELDKTVVDRIGDPLIHMVRNAVDHGLEASAEERVRAGKSAAGRVELRAFHKAGNIFIEVLDDGRGLDRETIVRKAREKGLIPEGKSLSPREIFDLVFLPGFSTAKQVTDVSGRGVGMDVVKRNIEALRGQVEISSEPGKGSCFSIRLPLTLAIIDGMVVRAGQERYIIPTLSVVTSLRPGRKEIASVLQRGQMLAFQGGLIPIFSLKELFDIPGAKSAWTEAVVVVIEDESARAGLVVDELLGQQQIVIKSLGDGLRQAQGISGGAIMPDGSVGLIMDVGGLIALAQASGTRRGGKQGGIPASDEDPGPALTAQAGAPEQAEALKVSLAG